MAILHLLSDALDKYSASNIDEYTNQYPVVLTMLICGILFTLGLEQLTLYIYNRTKEKQCPAYDPHKTQQHSHGNHPITDPEHGVTSSEASAGTHDHHLCDHAHPFSDAETLGNVLVFEASLGLHSIIIGFGLGALDDVSSIVSLLCALSFHQFFEGFTLGMLISEVQFLNHIQTSDAFKFSLMTFFALSTPIGIILGMSITGSQLGDTISGLANGFAAGCLVYGGLVEIISEEFSRVVEKEKPYIKPLMFSALCFGCASMAILAIWA